MSKIHAFMTTTALMVAILGDTLMPGSAKAAIESQLWHVVPWASLGHFVLFGCLGWVVAQQEPSRMAIPALLLAAALAGGTEWLQMWVPGRHPRLIDIGIDMAGALAGCTAAAVMFSRRGRYARRII
ncbi:MAG: VanZ family protein [Ramlibacter sp.]|nr:VanZ family protein [Ramlibacter sp.]